MNRIYLDNSAATPLDPEVFEAMKPYFAASFGNPGSLHSFGLETKKAVDETRDSIAKFLGCDATEIIFTSGGSESDNLAIRGMVESGNEKGKIKPHVIASAFEHKAVLDTVKSLEKEGLVEATYINPGADGVIKVEDVESAIQDNTILVSIMYVNNEIGTIQPIKEIGKMIQSARGREGERVRVFFHTDAVQAAEYLPMNVNDLGVDLLTLTAHKIYGPKGVGLLYVRRGTPITPQITGGGQEREIRAGTENVAGIAGFATAITKIKNSHCERCDVEAQQSIGKIASSKTPRNDETKKLRDKLIDGILNTIPDSILNGDRGKLAPHIANISFINAEGEAILLNLDFLGIAVSTGSACTSRSLEPSHVLTSMGIPPEKAHGSIRFSLGRHTTEEEIDQVIKVLPKIINKLRAMSPFS